MKKQFGDICQISIKPFTGNAVGYAIYPSEGEDEEQIFSCRMGEIVVRF